MNQNKKYIEDFIEKGADLEHSRWSKWQSYMHSKCVEHENGKGEWVCFPSESFRRWERQINTPYSDLSEKEKESDREQVREYIPLLNQILNQVQKEAYKQGQEDRIDGDMIANAYDEGVKEKRKKYLEELENMLDNGRPLNLLGDLIKERIEELKDII